MQAGAAMHKDNPMEMASPIPRVRHQKQSESPTLSLRRYLKEQEFISDWGLWRIGLEREAIGAGHGTMRTRNQC